MGRKSEWSTSLKDKNTTKTRKWRFKKRLEEKAKFASDRLDRIIFKIQQHMELKLSTKAEYMNAYQAYLGGQELNDTDLQEKPDTGFYIENGKIKKAQLGTIGDTYHIGKKVRIKGRNLEYEKDMRQYIINLVKKHFIVKKEA